MSEKSAFQTFMRRLLTGSLLAALLLLCVYIGLVRQNRARSYVRGLAAIDHAREFWPSLVADIETLRGKIQEEYGDSDSLLGNQRFINALDLMTIKQRERIVLSDGVKVSVYARIYLRTNNFHVVPIPGNTNLLSMDRDLWLPSTVEVIAAEQDILLSDFIADTTKPVWVLDPLELETRLNSNPGVISMALMVSAPGGYEKALSWVSQLFLMLCSFLLLFVPAYVWQDARGRYRRALLWTVAVALTNLVGLLAYLLFGRVTAITCYECGQAVSDQQKFCPYCRALLRTECSNCGQALGRNWRYCVKCGAKPER